MTESGAFVYNIFIRPLPGFENLRPHECVASYLSLCQPADNLIQ